MTIAQAMSEAKKLTGAVVDDDTLLRWLSELDGKIAFDVFGADGWSPYRSDETGDDLLVDYPWDGQIYVPYLEAMTYYETAEYERYANAKSMYETALWDFRKFYNRNHWPIAKCLTRCNNRREETFCPLQ